MPEPSIKCIDQIHEEMENMDTVSCIAAKIRSILKNFLNKQVPLAKNMVNELINTELSSINTNHPNFSIEDALQEADRYSYQPSAKIRKTQKDAEIIQNLVKNYFPIVKTIIQDQVPIVNHKIVN